MVDNVVVSDSWIDLKVLWENLEGRIVLAFGRVNSSRKSGFHDPNEFFIYSCFFPRKKTHGFFTTLRGTWVPHQCTLFLIMVKVFRSRLSQPKKSLE